MIEFDDIGPDGGGWDEDLPQPREPRRFGSPRARRSLTIAAVALAAGGLVTYAQLSGPDDRKPAARASSSSAPASPSATSADGGLLTEHLGDRSTKRKDVEVAIPARLIAPACPQSTDGFASCVVATTVPTAAVRAVRQRFPGAQNPSVSTATLRATDPGSLPGLWSRQFRAPLAHGGTLAILVTRNEAAAQVMPLSIQYGDTTVGYVRHVDARYTVQVQVRVPTAHAPSSAELSALAADARLTAP